jgi:hypothetical protein
MRNVFKLFYLSFFLLSLSQIGCALFGGGSDKLERSKEYAIVTPSEWAPSEGKGESDKAYRLKSGSVVTVTSSCDRGAGNSPVVLTKQLLIGARNVRYEKRQRILVDGKDGLHSTVKATLDGVPFHLEIVVLPTGTCVFDFSLMSPKPITDSEKSQFLEFVKSFHYGTS